MCITPSFVGLRPIWTKLLWLAHALVFTGSASISASALIPQVGWTVKSVDSQERTGEDGAAENAFDGDVSTFWHTEWWAQDPRHPHRIDIDLGSVHDIDGFRYLPRQDGGVNGRVKDYALYVSLDGITWGNAVARGAFPNSAQEKAVSFALTQGRYVRFEALSEVNGRPWTSMAELNLFGAVSSNVNVEPNGVINTPGDGTTIDVGDALNFVGSGIDPDSNALLSYRWTFGDPTVTGSTVKEPRNVVFNTPGMHTVKLTVVDHLGLADSTPATIKVTVNGPSADGPSADGPSATSVIPQTGWTLKSVDSQELVGENGSARNGFDGDVRTIWHTQWKAASPRHPHRIEIDLGTVHDLNGFQYLPRQDGGVNGRVKDYALYVSRDGVNWGSAVARGMFPNNAKQQDVLFAQTEGRYVRFEALSEVNGRPWTSVAELKLLGITSSHTVSTSPLLDHSAPAIQFYQDSDNIKAGTVLSGQQIRSEFGGYAIQNNAFPSGVTVVSDPASSGRGNALRVFFPKGKYGNAASGAAWQTKLSPRDEYYFAFDIYIPVGFNWPLGVKIPGLFGGRLTAASGLKATNGVDGFSVRQSIYSQRRNGDTSGYKNIGNGVLGANTYTYDGHAIPRVYNRNLNGAFNGAAKLIPGKWARIEQRVVLNDATNVTGVGVKRNGVYEAWVDGVKVYSSNNWIYRRNTSLKLDLVSFIWYYGGGSPDWGAREDQYIYFDNFAVSAQPITH